MEEAKLPPSLTPYTAGPPLATADQQKPLMKMLGKMMAKRIRLPHGKTNSQSITIKHKKVKYW